MKRIAFWSRDHIIAARILIAFCHILIFCLACYIGTGINKNNLLIPPCIFWLFTALFIVINVAFSKSYSSYSFNTKKILDGLIFLCAFVIMVSFANQKRTVNVTFYNSLHGSFSGKNSKASESVNKPTLRELRKQLKELKRLLKADRASAGGILLAVFVASLLWIFLAAASCSLSCSGQGGLAVLVLLSGITGIFFLCRFILKATRKKNKGVSNPKPGFTKQGYYSSKSANLTT